MTNLAGMVGKFVCKSFNFKGGTVTNLVGMFGIFVCKSFNFKGGGVTNFRRLSYRHVA